MEEYDDNSSFKTECCGFEYIGDNHSPFTTVKGKVVCKACKEKFIPVKNFKLLEKLEKLIEMLR